MCKLANRSPKDRNRSNFLSSELSYIIISSARPMSGANEVTYSLSSWEKAAPSSLLIRMSTAFGKSKACFYNEPVIIGTASISYATSESAVALGSSIALIKRWSLWTPLTEVGAHELAT